jgi:hypothetical protein
VTTPTKEIVVTPTRLAKGLAHTAVDTVRHPLTTASRAVGLVKGAASVALKTPAVVTETLATRTGAAQPSPDVTGEEPIARPDPGAPKPETAKRGKAEPAPGAGPAETAVPDLEPPDPADRVRVVEEALAAAQAESRAGRATEPSAASRDEEHGDATLQRAELDELAEEAAETELPGQVDVETPAGTTGADVAFNPDTAEADLHQPRTEDIIDPETAKALRSEAEMMRRAADTTDE